MLLLSALFPLILPMGGGVHNLYMLLAVVLLAAAYFWLLKEAVTKKLLVIYIAMFYAASQYCLVNLTLPLLNGGQLTGEVYIVWDLILYAAATAMMLPLAAYALSHMIRDYIREIEARNMKREFFLVMFSTLACFALMVYYSSVTGYAVPDF